MATPSAEERLESYAPMVAALQAVNEQAERLASNHERFLQTNQKVAAFQSSVGGVLNAAQMVFSSPIVSSAKQDESSKSD